MHVISVFYYSSDFPAVVDCLLQHDWLKEIACSAFSDYGTCCWFFFPGQLAAGTCEIVTLDRDSSQPRRTIARQTARCACKKGQIAGTTRARPACVDGKRRKIILTPYPPTRN